MKIIAEIPTKYKDFSFEQDERGISILRKDVILINQIKALRIFECGEEYSLLAATTVDGEFYLFEIIKEELEIFILRKIFGISGIKEPLSTEKFSIETRIGWITFNLQLNVVEDESADVFEKSCNERYNVRCKVPASVLKREEKKYIRFAC